MAQNRQLGLTFYNVSDAIKLFRFCLGCHYFLFLGILSSDSVTKNLMRIDNALFFDDNNNDLSSQQFVNSVSCKNCKLDQLQR